MSIATASDLETAPARPLLTPLLSAAACVALADWLFYGWQVGISLALFFAVLAGVAVIGHRARVTPTLQAIMAAIFIAGLASLIEDVNMTSVAVSALATALFVIVITTRESSSWQRDLFEAVTIPFRGPFELVGDLIAALSVRQRQVPKWLSANSLVAWIIPLTACAVFLALFASANPLIEYRLTQIDLRSLINLLDPARIGFWILLVCAIWPLLLRRVLRLPDWPSEPAAAAAPTGLDHLFGVQAVTRSLILFNALFALQTALDLTYLWGGANLPGGMSHAEYAHRGAYPLIVTALLAAGFVLIAMRPGGPAGHSRLIRPLVLAWTGQNVLLVISSIFRLDLYVAAYSLTYLRLAAFIWMVLVAIGLVLMLIQIELQKPSSWLITANAISLALVLYICCFINTPRLVATYNVKHCREIGGTGPNLDLQYLRSLGPQALPPLEAHIDQLPLLRPLVDHFRFSFAHPKNWREWGFRTWRLQRYLANNPGAPLIPSKNSDRG